MEAWVGGGRKGRKLYPYHGGTVIASLIGSDRNEGSQAEFRRGGLGGRSRVIDLHACVWSTLYNSLFLLL